MLVVDDAKAWLGVDVIVIGEEGRGRDKWRMSFKPSPASCRQEFPAELARRRGGWFFARIYNQDGELTQSLDFRFHAALTRIDAPTFSSPPNDGYYESAEIKIVHTGNLWVSPVSEQQWKNALACSGGMTVIKAKPRAAFDESEWDLGPTAGRSVRVRTLVERLWWRIRRSDGDPGPWNTRFVNMQEDDFKANSEAELCILLPCAHWTDSFGLGFSDNDLRTYKPSSGERRLSMRLREFDLDHLEPDAQVHTRPLVRVPLREFDVDRLDRTQSSCLKIWFVVREQEFALTVGTLPASGGHGQRAVGINVFRSRK
jgi:hypothetical protein